jgi:hypothetical protein
MPRFIIERNFAEQLEVNRDVITTVTQVNADVGVRICRNSPEGSSDLPFKLRR